MAFFTVCQNLFIVVKEEFSEDKALDIFSKVLERGLRAAYDSMGFTKGNVQDFARVLKERDESVGLYVEFPEISENKIIYQFHTDPFPGLKGYVYHKKLDDTYIAFKVRYLLGDEWRYENTKHFWDGDDFTEYVITK